MMPQTHGEVAPVYAIYAGNSAAVTSTTLTMDEQNDCVVDTTANLTDAQASGGGWGGVGVGVGCWCSVYTCLVTDRRHVRSDAPGITVYEDAPIHSDVVRISAMRRCEPGRWWRRFCAWSTVLWFDQINWHTGMSIYRRIRKPYRDESRLDRVGEQSCNEYDWFKTILHSVVDDVIETQPTSA